MKLIGLSGTNGSGKDTVAEILVSDFGFYYISFSHILRKEATKQNLIDSRENLRKISSDLRKKFGEDVLVVRAIEHYYQLKRNYAGLVLGSIRNSGEAEAIKKNGGYLFWIDAEAKTRYSRIQKNLEQRNHRATDRVSFEQFIQDELAEMKINQSNPSLDMAKVKRQSDIQLTNNSTKSDLLISLTRSLSELFPHEV
jgi:dephospho-CoA kinase